MEMRISHVAAVLVMWAVLGHVSALRPNNPIIRLNHAFANHQFKIHLLRRIIADLSRQVMLQQFFMEERIRTDGNSGVKVIRGGPKGLNNYDAATHSNSAFMAIHDHSNYDRTLGMGEFAVVLNGLEFRTRHNDYKLVMPSTTSQEFNAVENVPFPPVPEAVTSKPTVPEQIAEMREWFKAYWTQNTTHRDFRPYFTPVIAYLEGEWTTDKDLVESFQSDRHALAASSWKELQQKARYASYTGIKDTFENLATLPTTIVDVNETTGIPQYGQWNYRVLCYPLNRYLPFTLLQQAEDRSLRVGYNWTLPETLEKRAARFKLYEGNGKQVYQLLDEIMYQIPGKDNRYSKLTQNTFTGKPIYDMAYPKDDIPLDTSRYHRWYKNPIKDAMGEQDVARGYNDENMFVAQTTNERVAHHDLEKCQRNRDGKKVCTITRSRFTYAIPMEIMYLTPLLSWNPYNLTIHQGLDIVDKDGRDGEEAGERAYNGVDSNHYYLTPVEFFSGERAVESAADTVRNAVYIKGPDGKSYKTAASGSQIMLQKISGVGRVRTRFPIAPVHGEGSSVWKELNAIRDSMAGTVKGEPDSVLFQVENNGEHSHTFVMEYRTFIRLVTDRVEMHVTTDESAGHRHELTIKYHKNGQKYEIVECDGERKCPDKHPRYFTVLNKNVYTDAPFY